MEGTIFLELICQVYMFTLYTNISSDILKDVHDLHISYIIYSRSVKL